jgi:hypothetical protein
MAVAADQRTAVPTVPPPDAPSSWHRTDIVAVIVFALVGVGVFWFIHRFAVNTIFFDQWADINVIMHAHDGTLSFATLWDQHNENRILFPNLIVLALADTTHFNIVVEDRLSGIFVVVTTALLIVAHKRRSPAVPWILYCPVVLVFLSFAPLTSSLFGFLVSWYLVMVALAVALFLLDRVTLTWMTMAGALAAAVVGSYSSLQGLFIWPAGLVLLYLRRRDLRTVTVWLVAAVVTTILYFVNFDWAATGGHASSALSHPGPALRFFLESLGNVTGSPVSAVPGSVNTLALVLGIIVLAVAVVALVIGFRGGREGGGALGVALICYGLIFVAFTTLGRIQLGLYDESRFATFDLFLWVGAYLVLLGPVAGAVRELVARWRDTDRAGHPSVVTRSTVVAALAMGILSGLFVLQVLLGFTNGLNEGRAWHQSQSDVADVTANIDAAPDQAVRTFSPYAYSTEEVRRLAAFASADRLSLFATSLASTDRRSGLIAEATTRVVRPSNGAVLSGKALLDATAASTTDIATVQFVVTGHGLHDAIVATGQPSPYGWLASWDTATVADGTYQLHSAVQLRSTVRLHGAVSSVDGKTVEGPAITVTVHNRGQALPAG